MVGIGEYGWLLSLVTFTSCVIPRPDYRGSCDIGQISSLQRGVTIAYELIQCFILCQHFAVRMFAVWAGVV